MESGTALSRWLVALIVCAACGKNSEKTSSNNVQVGPVSDGSVVVDATARVRIFGSARGSRVTGLHVSESALYVLTPSGLTVLALDRAPLDEPRSYDGFVPLSVATLHGGLYFTSTLTGDELKQLDLDTGKTKTVVSRENSPPGELIVHGEKLVWTSGSKLLSVGTDGKNVQTLVADGVTGPMLSDGERVYVALEASLVEIVDGQQTRLADLQVGSLVSAPSHAYVLDKFGVAWGIPKDGSKPVRIATDLPDLQGLALANGWLYATHRDGSGVSRVRVKDGNRERVSTANVEPGLIVAAGGNVYWVAGTRIYRAAVDR